MRRPNRSPRLATLCLQGNTAASTTDNAERVLVLEELVRVLQKQPAWHPIDAIVLPGGFFWLSKALGPTDFDRRREITGKERFTDSVTSVLGRLHRLSPNIRLVTGAMAKPRKRRERIEQACLAFDRGGLIGAARKMFPTRDESRGRRYMFPYVEDYSSPARFIDLPNGSVALLNSCYDLFGTADLGTGTGSRRSAIRALRHERDRLILGDEGFSALRDSALSAWAKLVGDRMPDVLLAAIHAFERPGLDGYWQRHGIARASASQGGALTVGAAHFLEYLPEDGSTLAAYGVPKRELAAGVSRKAHSLAPIHSTILSIGKANALLRVFEPPPGRWKAKPGRSA